MTGAEFKAALARIKVTQYRLAKLLDQRVSTVNRWAVGAAAVPPALVVLIHVLEHTSLTIADVEEIMRDAST